MSPSAHIVQYLHPLPMLWITIRSSFVPKQVGEPCLPASGIQQDVIVDPFRFASSPRLRQLCLEFLDLPPDFEGFIVHGLTHLLTQIEYVQGVPILLRKSLPLRAKHCQRICDEAGFGSKSCGWAMDRARNSSLSSITVARKLSWGACKWRAPADALPGTKSIRCPHQVSRSD
jgi:hypothetical protein